MTLLLWISFLTTSAQKTSDTRENAQYNEAISNADRYLLVGNYLMALNEYERAWDLYPRQKYPEKKIDQINKTLINTPLSRILYEEAIKQGDSNFTANDFKKANTAYYNALRLDPAAQYPRDQLSDISTHFNDPQNELRCRIILIHASRAVSRARYDKAIEFYKQVLVLKPTEKWLEKKIEEITILKEKTFSGSDAYVKLISESDNLLEQKKWTEAREGYSKALAIKPKENYPAAKIVFIDHAMAHKTGSQVTYALLIENADIFYKLQDYENAAILYQQGLNLKPGEQYPKSMLKKLSHKTDDKNKSYIQYEASVINADLLSMAGDIEAALIGYQRGAALIPDDPYVKSRISELSAVTTNINENQNAYLLAVSKGDKSFEAKNYTKALSEYRYASWLKPDETYPKARTEEIQNIMQNVKAKTDQVPKEVAAIEVITEKAVDNIPTADELQKPISSSKEKSEEIKQSEVSTIAETLIPQANNTDIPDIKKDNPVEILSIANAEIKQGPPLPETKTQLHEPITVPDSTQNQYERVLASADNSLSESRYDAAVSGYQSALLLKPEEEYPRRQIEMIADLPGNQKAHIARPETKTGVSVQQVTETAVTDPKNTPTTLKQQVVKPDVVKIAPAKQSADEESYSKAIDFADKAFADQNYQHAVNGYKAALKIKPSEKYPQEKIEWINTILDGQKVVQEKYKNLIITADKAFSDKKYSDALSGYQSALVVLPAQKYPLEKIAAINVIMGQSKALDDTYSKTIASADRAFAEKKYSEALNRYENALKLKPSEEYPEQRIEAINTLLGLTKEQQENYRNAISLADQSMAEKSYDEALRNYQSASEIKPGEAYPKQKIASINVILGQQKAKQDRYSVAIRDADLAYEDKDYVAAITSYKSALGLFPDETHPRERIETINALLIAQKASREGYNKALMAAEKAFAAKDYPAAISGFQSAQAFLPEEKYPDERITVIVGIISMEKERLDRQYNEYISQADQLFLAQDFLLAQKAYYMASALKPEEEYPKARHEEIAGLLSARARAVKEAYNKAITDADNAYKSLIFDQAVNSYSKALEIKPGEIYPGQMIARIRKYMMENSVVEVTSEGFLLKKDSEKSFSFKPVDINLRKNNYLVVRARNTGNIAPKLYINYGCDKLKNGGIVLKNINTGLLNDFVINISMQDKWFREDNNWLSFYSENGDLEVASVRISQGK